MTTAFRDMAALVLMAISGFVTVPLHAQTTNGAEYASGSAAELERNHFKRFLQPGQTVEDVPFHDLFLATISAMYQITGQYVQVLRLCRYGAEAAKTGAEREQQRMCQRSALVNLGRFSEAEALAVEDGKLLPSSQNVNAGPKASDWMWTATLNLNLGQTQVAESAFQRVVEAIEQAREGERRQIGPADPRINANLRAIHDELRADLNRNNEQYALQSLAEIAYFRQRYDEFGQLIDRLLAVARTNPRDSNVPAELAVDQALRFYRVGDVTRARAIAKASLPQIKAGAGFRDQPEPLQSFVPLQSAVVVLGDERTQQVHVRAWLRLVIVYALLGRQDEAARLLEATRALASRYVLEPEAANTLLAAVEETCADIAMMNQVPDLSVAQLRSARQRLVNAGIPERSNESGRRQARLDSPLLSVNAKLLRAYVRQGKTVWREEREMKEIASILHEFTMSRAILNSQLAERAAIATDANVSMLLRREGTLIDELVSSRGQIAADVARTPGAMAQGSQITARIRAIYGELETIKTALADAKIPGAKVTDHDISRFHASLGSARAYWQWITHPEGNFIVCWTSDGIHIAPLPIGVHEIEERAGHLRQKGSLRLVRTISQLPVFPADEAAVLYQFLFGQLAPVAIGREHWILANAPLVDGLPWGALVTAPTAHRAEPAWLGMRTALSIVPSWRATLSLARESSSAAKKILLIGDPHNSNATIKPGELSVRGLFIAKATNATPEVAPRDNAFGQEITALSRLYPHAATTVLRGSDATKKKLLALPLDQYRTLVFSTHGYLAKEFSTTLGPSLEMTARSKALKDRLLTAAEIARLRLDAQLVVLSACDTSAPDGYPDSEGLSGLTSAFLLAGARNVLVSLWPVETQATKTLITSMFRIYQKNEEGGVASAMQRATRDYLASSDPLRRHPAFWSAFVHVGQ